MENNIEMDFK